MQGHDGGFGEPEVVTGNARKAYPVKNGGD